MILTTQMMITAAIVSPLVLIESSRLFLQEHMYLAFVAMAGYFVCVIVLSCFRDVGRKFPQNYIFLGILTLCLSLFLGFVAGSYDTIEILIAVGITAVMTFSITVFAFFTRCRD
ncbi:hypothetical protein Pcinc_042875 [Petrolisthes cinctipes]|uniref:Uncharacterized protein n=1 Tax=Petrolisthes cinctipes TaxID=88211 RepID=A0AAE1BKA5_PETCI|nr:hypothetical protein Pcinc_042875 [Petrolisthes cinctipes]